MATSIGAQTLLNWRRQQLQAGGRASSLDWLLDLQGGVGWQALQQLRLRPEQPVELRCSLEQLEQLWQRHLQTDEPLQYLVGCCPWRDLELEVGPGVLIPRQETELLVDLAHQLLLQDGAGAPRRWADLGTGSGCLAVALARQWPASEGWAVDQSAAALQQAGRNLEQHQLQQRVQLRQGSWWQPLQQQWGKLNLVISNPPYIPTGVWQQLEPGVRNHEPALALDGGPDGLEAIRRISAGASAALAPAGLLLLEHHYDQSAAVLELLQQAGLHDPQPHQDLEGVWRFASAWSARWP